ncbi:predicted protein [Uncinocarpus reesii 1704]|uniref:Dolichyl-diphosphooligosaccharide--protein glycosyltransferase subunit 4 n=1 Tax=Uncinocarpus reesii (strain UAMH 1704) TaxID=336963 RepID=C4JQF3_UNCRE|nr:uncharacterized protein UREG_04707 [Uncinocarpus reesii 1704]EEP79861.1 predicted protein [Uncinocarpus reesii 1704]
MITDSELYKLAIFLGSCAMLLIVLYHFLEVNSKDKDDTVADGGTSSSVNPKNSMPTNLSSTLATTEKR